jgi:protein-disulfide isomerase
MTYLTRMLACVAIGWLLTGAIGSHEAAAAELDKSQVEQIIHDYLMQHPEVIENALTEMQRRANEDQEKAQVATVESKRELLLASTHQAVLGNPQGDVTLVEFFDYNCPYCRKAATDITAILDQDPKLRVVLKEWPILGPESVEAAQVSIAARVQDGGARFRVFHEKLLATHGRANKATALAAAEAAGYDVHKIQNEPVPEAQATVTEVNDLSNALAITGTPTFVVGRQVVSGAVGADALKTLIAKAREECKQPTC